MVYIPRTEVKDKTSEYFYKNGLMSGKNIKEPGWENNSMLGQIGIRQNML